jgi:hypothetical protein
MKLKKSTLANTIFSCCVVFLALVWFIGIKAISKSKKMKILFLFVVSLFFLPIQAQVVEKAFNNLFYNYTNAFKSKNYQAFISCLDSNYLKRDNIIELRKLFETLSKNDFIFYDEINELYDISDTINYSGKQYILVPYSASRKIKLGNSVTNKSNIIDFISKYFKCPFYYNNTDSSYVSERPGTFLVMKTMNSNKWTLFDYDKKTIFNYCPIKDKDALFKLEKLDCGVYKPTNFNCVEIGKYVFEALKNNNYKNIYCELGYTKNTLESLNFMKFDTLSLRKKNDFFYEFCHRKLTIDSDLDEIHRNTNFSEAVFSQVHAKIYQNKNNTAYSDVLVEYQIQGKFKYFEIECALLKDRWIIWDNIHGYPSAKDNIEFIKNNSTHNKVIKP